MAQTQRSMRERERERERERAFCVGDKMVALQW